MQILNCKMKIENRGLKTLQFAMLNLHFALIFKWWVTLDELNTVGPSWGRKRDSGAEDGGTLSYPPDLYGRYSEDSGKGKHPFGGKGKGIYGSRTARPR
jgi:hypothetical protein